MAEDSERLTVQDFLDSGWEQVVEQAEYKDCNLYVGLFCTKAREAQEAGNYKRELVFGLLCALTSLMLHPDKVADPFRPATVFSNGSSSATSDTFSDTDLAYFGEILEHIPDPELKARVADLLWIRKKNHVAGQIAVRAYLDADTALEAEPRTVRETRIERAYDLVKQLGNRDLFNQVTQYIETCIQKTNKDEDGSPSFFALKLMKLLQSRRMGDPIHYGELAEAMALESETAGVWLKAREFWDTAARWHSLNNDADRSRKAKIASAETFVTEARIAAGSTPTGYMRAVHWQERAIHAYRKIGGQQQRIDELHHELLRYQENAVSEMGTISHEIDATDMIAKATTAVKGKHLGEAILSFASMGKSPNVEHLERQAKEENERFVFSRLFGTTFVNAMGRTVAHSEGHIFDEDQTDLTVAMHRGSSMAWGVYAQGLIEPAREQILFEHNIRVDDFLGLVTQHPFVPEDRQLIYARGLHAGMYGDFTVATHFLIPQVENSIRYLLAQKGIISSGLTDAGIQDEANLNETLCVPRFKEPLTEILGKDVVFDLQGLLISRYGANLRNTMAHGLMRDGEFDTYPCIYFWWLTLRLLCIPIINSLKQRANTEQNSDLDDVVPTNENDARAEDANESES